MNSHPPSNPGRVDILVPCYNEEQVLAETATRLRAVRQRMLDQGKITPASTIYLVDDGSKDKTWSMIDTLSTEHPEIAGIKLSRNFGHQSALLAGLSVTTADAAVTIDADLQDDVDAIEAMVDQFNQGSQVVLGVRGNRDTDSAFKRFTAESFYRLLGWMGVELVFNHADYRLLGRAALDAFAQFGESNLFLRGIVPQLGFPTSIVTYDRAERFAGESKYPLRKMLKFAVDGITSFSTLPLRWVSMLGIVFSLLSLAGAVWVLVVKLSGLHAVPGWASLMLLVLLIGGLQITCLGVIGSYVGRIYNEVKGRPRYILEHLVGENGTSPVTTETNNNDHVDRSLEQPVTDATV